MGGAHGNGDLARGQVGDGMIAHIGYLAFQQRCLQVLALAGAFPGKEGGGYGAVGHHAGENIHHRIARPQGGSPLFPSGAHQATVSLDDQVIARAVRQGAGPAKAGDGAVHHPRVGLPYLVIADAHAVGRARPIAFDHHIGVLRQLEADIYCLGMPQVQGDAALVAIE